MYSRVFFAKILSTWMIGQFWSQKSPTAHWMGLFHILSTTVFCVGRICTPAILDVSWKQQSSLPTSRPSSTRRKLHSLYSTKGKLRCKIEIHVLIYRVVYGATQEMTKISKKLEVTLSIRESLLSIVVTSIKNA